MPIVRDIPLNLKIGKVLRREGLREYARVRPEIKSLILGLLEDSKKAHLCEGSFAYEIYPIGGLRLEESAALWQGLTSVLPEAKELAIVVATIGSKLEKQVTEYTSKGEPLRALLLDGIGSAAVDALSEKACQTIAQEALSRGYQASSPINPGMPGLPITTQAELLKLVPANEIGVSLTKAGVMVPRKSVSMVIGLGPRMRTWTRAEVCARCHLRKTCPYKIKV